MLIFSNSRSGQLTLSCNNTQIHSLYNPDIEAKKYLDTICRDYDLNPEVVILVGPGLNYLLPHVKNKYSSSKILVIHFSEELYLKSFPDHSNNVKHWHPEMDIPLKSFLYANIDELNLFSKMIITWDPSLKAFPETAKNILSVLNQVLNEYSSNISTTNYFGKRYIKNVLKNIFDITKIIVPEKLYKPVVVTASGPSLSDSIGLIKEYRDYINLIALSSSCRLLREHGITPDIIMTTDPGFYSSCHIDFSYSDKSVLAAPLTSYPMNFSHKNILLLNQGSFLENYFLNNALLPFIKISTNGTVAGSAYYLASLIADSPVIFAGLDLCSSDILAHAIPNNFNILNTGKEKRTNPQYSLLFKEVYDSYPETINRSSHISVQLKAYASWFNSLQRNLNYYRLNKSAVELSSFKDIDEQDFISIITGKSFSNYSSNSLNCDVISVDTDVFKKKIQSAADHLIGKLRSRYKECLKSPHLINLRNSFENEILYYYNTNNYLELQEFKKKENHLIFQEKYFSLISSCIYYFEKYSSNILKAD